MSKRNKGGLPDIAVNSQTPEDPPFDDGDPGDEDAPAGSAFTTEATEEGAAGAEEGQKEDTKEKPEPPPAADAATSPTGGGARVMTRREQIEARLAEIERDGGPIGRTQRVNENMKELRAERDRQMAEWDKEIAEMRAQVRALEARQQAELEEVRVLKIELSKLAD